MLACDLIGIPGVLCVSKVGVTLQNFTENLKLINVSQVPNIAFLHPRNLRLKSLAPS